MGIVLGLNVVKIVGGGRSRRAQADGFYEVAEKDGRLPRSIKRGRKSLTADAPLIFVSQTQRIDWPTVCHTQRRCLRHAPVHPYP